MEKLELNKIYQGDCLEVLATFPSESIDCVVTSPPYWALRDYGMVEQLGLETTFEEYINKLVSIFDEIKRVLKADGTLWVNIGDTYSGNKIGKTDNKVSNYLKEQTNIVKKKGSQQNKCLLQIPSRFAIAMTDNGWILRNEVIWHKPNAMPSSVNDRFTVDYEKMFFFTKSQKYYYNQQKEQMITTDKTQPRGSKGVIGQLNSGLRKQDNVGRNDYTGFNDRYTTPTDFQRNKRCVWSINTKPTKELHFAVFPEALIETPIKAGCKPGGVVLDLFMGSGTTAVVAKKLGFDYVGIELNESYIKIAEKRIAKTHYQEHLEL